LLRTSQRRGALKQVLLINPNSSRQTTAMMVEIARACSPANVLLIGATATRSPPMIVTREHLTGAAAEVIEIGSREAAKVSGIVIAAFGVGQSNCRKTRDHCLEPEGPCDVLACGR